MALLTISSFPDLNFVVEDIIAEGDKVVTSGKPDSFVQTHDWLGMISAGFSIRLQQISSRWSHSYRS
jgi:predicted ester cyclase